MSLSNLKFTPLTRPPLRSGDLSPLGRGGGERWRVSLLPRGEKVAAKRPDEGAIFACDCLPCIHGEVGAQRRVG